MSEKGVKVGMEKGKLVPRLRFPEFVGDGEWKIKEIGKLLSIGNGRDHKHLSQGNIPVYGSGGLMRFVDDYLHDGESVCIGRKGTINKPVFLSGKFWTVDTLFYTHSFKKCLPKFIFILFQNIDWLKYNEAGGIPSLSKTNIEKIEVSVPKGKEQQKIADCLTSLDELITAENEKLDALKTHKKGLMQQLFPREGESVPRLRFSEFVKDGKWETRKLGQIGDVLMCKRIFSHDTNPIAGVPFYKIGTLCEKPDAFISKELFDAYKKKYNFPRVGEVLITCSGTVGKCLQYDGKDAYYQDSNIVWIDNPDLKVANAFLYILLSNVDWGRLNSTTITRIYGADLRELVIKFPSEKEEQQKIAVFLTSIDDQITTQIEKIESLNQHKKGLMNQLFPN